MESTEHSFSGDHKSVPRGHLCRFKTQLGKPPARFALATSCLRGRRNGYYATEAKILEFAMLTREFFV